MGLLSFNPGRVNDPQTWHLSVYMLLDAKIPRLDFKRPLANQLPRHVIKRNAPLIRSRVLDFFIQPMSVARI